MDSILYPILIVVLFLCYAFVTGVRKAFISLSVFQILQLKESEEMPTKLIARLVNKQGRLFSLILLLKFIVIFLIFLFVGYLPKTWLSHFSNLGILTIILVLLGLSDLFSSISARGNTMGVIKFACFPLIIFYYLLFPIVWFLSLLVGKSLDKQLDMISLDEISEVIENADMSRELDQDEANLLKGVVRFSDIEAKSVMRERIAVVAIEHNSSFEKVLKTIMDSGYSRFPVYDEKLDKILGIIVLKDLLPLMTNTEKCSWQDKIRPALFVEETTKIDDLLPAFRKKKNHFAIVVDEYGGTSGIITLEDILEEIVGEITDESDFEEQEQIGTKISDKVWSFEANTSINDFCKVLNLDEDFFEEAEIDAESLGGLVLELCGEFPKLGQTVTYQHINFKVSETDQRRITKLLITVNTPENEDS